MARPREECKVSQEGRDGLIAFRRNQLEQKAKKTRSKVLPKLTKVRGAIKRLEESIGELPPDPLMLDIAHLPFTPEGRNSISSENVPPGACGRIVPPPGMAEEVWVRILQQDPDPVRSELEILKKALERASAVMDCTIGRKGEPGPQDGKQDRHFFLWECFRVLFKETGKLPVARVLGQLAMESSGEHGGNWKREAEDFITEINAKYNSEKFDQK